MQTILANPWTMPAEVEAMGRLLGLENPQVETESDDEADVPMAPETIEAREKRFQLEAVPYLDALYNFAVRMCGDSDDASDLVQETYMKAWRFFDSFVSGTNCKAWLFRILKNTYINRYRKASRQPDTVDYDEIQHCIHLLRSDRADANDLQESYFNGLLGDEITVAVKRLPADFRSVVMLCDVEGLTYEEIAQAVGCPIGTVRSRLHRGRKLLRAQLTTYARTHGFLTDAPAFALD